MNSKSIDKLEFNKIKEEIKKRAVCSAGAEKVEALTPFDTPQEAARALREVDAAGRLLSAKGAPPFEGVYDAREELLRAQKGGTLNPKGLLHIGNLLRSARLFLRYGSLEEGDVSALTNLLQGITPLPRLEEDIAQAILSEEEIADRASMQLYGIRKALKEKSGSVKEKIQGLVRSNAKYLQEALYTVRGDRYVIPVKAEHKGQVPGLVHDQSASGQTVYIEPMSLVQLNNEIRELMLKEASEIQRILRELSAKVTAHHPAVARDAQIIYELDSIFARAKYAAQLFAVSPLIQEDGTFHLISARHPLLPPKKAVPSTIWLGEDFTSLVITGPNTGGKTVTLKTVGLLHVMALSGVPIPVNEGSHISFFREVYADIGDEQSIEQSLSTFSSHMTNIVEIMKGADDSSLVLFDELGAGTDPTEGAALAMALLETLKQRGSRVIATTHYSELKAYALRTSGVENASVEFDVHSLRPTYRLLIGVPGKSNAFLISQRLGLSLEIIEEARTYLTEDSLRFEDLLENLETSNQRARTDAQKADALRRSLERQKEELEKKLAGVDALREKELEDARREARGLLRNVKEEADDILKSLRRIENQGYHGSLRQELEKNRQSLRDTLALIDAEEKAKEANEPEDQSIKKSIRLGKEYHHRTIAKTVSVLTLPDEKGDLQVQAGIMKINANLRDLLPLKKEAGAPKKNPPRSVSLNLRSVPSSLDLRGLDAEEAAYRTDQYLDEAAMGGLSEVTIIHGVGTGVLKNRINGLLNKHPHVRAKRPGAYGEGGAGVTIAELK
ncbi:Recombination inhibitory protein MutS2 [Clostridiaceae bacterium JG1575]|nr:Recombination inhibitory protein MutS2 [Clostridiaceae bacterium JG1575]